LLFWLLSLSVGLEKFRPVKASMAWAPDHFASGDSTAALREGTKAKFQQLALYLKLEKAPWPE
jgi:hypothetical protein